MTTIGEIIRAASEDEGYDLLLQLLNENYATDLDAMDPDGSQLIRGSGGSLEGEYVDPREWHDDGDTITAVTTLTWTESQHGIVVDSGSLDMLASIDKDMEELTLEEYVGGGIEPEFAPEPDDGD